MSDTDDLADWLQAEAGHVSEVEIRDRLLRASTLVRDLAARDAEVARLRADVEGRPARLAEWEQLVTRIEQLEAIITELVAAESESIPDEDRVVAAWHAAIAALAQPKEPGENCQQRVIDN